MKGMTSRSLQPVIEWLRKTMKSIILATLLLNSNQPKINFGNFKVLDFEFTCFLPECTGFHWHFTGLRQETISCVVKKEGK
jgi:hypothetical protein